MNKLKANINAAMARKKAGLVLKNAFIINVYTQSIEINDIAINDEIIVGVGKYEGEEEIDCTGLFVAPGFIDSHVHIESSMVTPEIFSHIALSKGVTTSIADPHEIGNVMGVQGLQFMLDNSEKSVMDIFYMVPSCVPATNFEDNGAELTAAELRHFLHHKRVLGLGEVMDAPSVLNSEDSMLSKLKLFNKKNIDGHCPGISERGMNAYLCAGINTDHECSTYEEALKKLQRGFYVMLREGSAAKNLIDILPAVNRENFSRFLYCTDDRHIEDLMDVGSIDNAVRISIEEGLDPIKAFTIASLNPASCYGLRDRGAIAPGLLADLIIFEDLRKVNIVNVIKNGRVYDGKFSYSKQTSNPSVNLNYIDKDVFKIKAEGSLVNVIRVMPKSIVTKKEIRRVNIKNHMVSSVEGEGILKIAVLERHRNSGKRSVGFIEGLGLRDCALALTIAHDSHNIIVAGDDDQDMAIAVNSLIALGGGIVLVSQGKIIDCLSLPIGGLMTCENPVIIKEKVKNLTRIARQYGVQEDVDPFLTLGFMALPVIPHIKITARGLFDFDDFKFISLYSQTDQK